MKLVSSGGYKIFIRLFSFSGRKPVRRKRMLFLPVHQGQILDIIKNLQKKNQTSVIMITHDLGVVASMCDRIAVMYAGRIVEYGTTDDIFYRPHHMYTKGLIRSIPRLDTKEHERLVPIEGTPVDLLNPPAGCPFAPRCEACMKICLREMPPVIQFMNSFGRYLLSQHSRYTALFVSLLRFSPSF